MEIPASPSQDIPIAAARRIEFVVEKRAKVKGLYGFKKGHKVPPFGGAKAQAFLNGLAEQNISEHIERVSAKLCDLFKLKVDDYEIRQKGGEAVFECALLMYEYTMRPNEEDANEVVFSAKLAPIKLLELLKYSGGLDACFPGWFDYLRFRFSKSLDLRELVRKIEAAKEAGTLGDFDYSYNAQVTLLKVADSLKARDFEISGNELRILFRSQEKLVEMLDSLKDISNKMALLSEQALLDS